MAAPLLSANTQAILLLTAPLLVGGAEPSRDLLGPGGYKRLAARLMECGKRPADLLSEESSAILQACEDVIEPERVRRLLGRSFQLAQAVDRWQNRGIWVVSRADAGYPRRLKSRLREDAPPVLYGCGDSGLLDKMGLAVVGSRNVGPEMLEFAVRAGRLCAEARGVLVSGGAKGVDQAAMRGALASQGHAVGVLADSLERAVITREHRSLLMEERLALASPCDPAAGFNVGNAMQRNKLIYALSDAALVVHADFQKGGTWAGAVEQLEKLHLVPVFLRGFLPEERGMEGLRRKGAIPWPEGLDAQGLAALLSDGASHRRQEDPRLDLSYEATEVDSAPLAVKEAALETLDPRSGTGPGPREILFQVVRDLAKAMAQPVSEGDFAEALDIQKGQARIWLKRLAQEQGVKAGRKSAGGARKSPETAGQPGSLASQPPLFEN